MWGEIQLWQKEKSQLTTEKLIFHSASNEFEAEAYALFRPGRPPDSGSPYPRRDLSGNPVGDSFSRAQYGGSLGLPLVVGAFVLAVLLLAVVGRMGWGSYGGGSWSWGWRKSGTWDRKRDTNEWKPTKHKRSSKQADGDGWIQVVSKKSPTKSWTCTGCGHLPRHIPPPSTACPPPLCLVRRALLCWVDLLVLFGPILAVALRRHPLPRRLRLVAALPLLDPWAWVRPFPAVADALGAR